MHVAAAPVAGLWCPPRSTSQAAASVPASLQHYGRGNSAMHVAAASAMMLVMMLALKLLLSYANWRLGEASWKCNRRTRTAVAKRTVRLLCG